MKRTVPIQQIQSDYWGYIVRDGTIKPDPERLKLLMDTPVPRNSSALQHAFGIFAHNCRWIPGFSDTSPTKKETVSAL